MSPQTSEMVSVARSYCSMIEDLDAHDSTWLEQLAVILPRLHAAVAALGVPAEEIPHIMAVNLDSRFELFSKLRQLLGERDPYWMEFDVAEHSQSMSGSLADDLTDIYCELKHGLALFNGEPSRALNDWRSSYKMHWGQHLVDAERHLYSLQARGLLNL